MMAVQPNGNPEGHQQWEWEDALLMQQQQQQQPAILGVEQTDVMMGRGLGPRNHPGNQRYRAIVENHRIRYESAGTRPEKTRIVDDIVGIIKQTGRFLKRVEGGIWIEVDDMAARAKVGQTLRHLRRVSGKAEEEAYRAIFDEEF